MQTLEKVGRNTSLVALAVMLAVLPFTRRSEATYQAAQVFMLLGFVLRLIGQMRWRFWVAAVVLFAVSMGAFAAIAAVCAATGHSTFGAREVIAELLTEIGVLYFGMILLFLSQYSFRPDTWTAHDRWTRVTLALAWAFVLVVIISAICSVQPVEPREGPMGSMRYLRKFLAPFVLVYMVLVETLYSWRHYRILITTVYLVGILTTTASVTARYFYIYGNPDLKRSILVAEILIDQQQADGRHEIRNQWPFEHHNRLCSYTVVLLVFVWLQFLITRNWELKTLVAISAAVPFWCMIVTLTRGGWIAFAAAVVVLVTVLNWRYVWVPVAVALATWLISPHVVRDRLTSVARDVIEGRGTVSLRQEIWNRSFEIVKGHPVLGLGAGWEIFEAHFQQHYPRLRPDEDTSHAHNNFLEVAVESGLPAMALLLAFTAMLLVQIVRARAANPNQRVRRFVVAGFVAMLVGIVVFGLTNYSLRYRMGMMLWVCFGMMTLLPAVARHIPEKETMNAE